VSFLLGGRGKVTMKNFGWYFKLRLEGIWVMLNGRMFSIFKGCNTKKWQFSIWDNYWRKNNIDMKDRFPNV
jgi:hypothetical protein